jgi:uncharacterized PurR-regulated membrane protein YhhQ (DUF165 family)
VNRNAHSLAAFGALVGSVWLANWLISNVGFERAPGLHVIPVWWGIDAPSGVIAIGVSLTARDILHETAGSRVTMVAICLGAALSALVSPGLAIASGTAYLLAETADMIVYTPLRHRSPIAGSIASNIVGSLADSVVFVWLAFGPAGLLGLALSQVLGKLEWSLMSVAVLVAGSFAANRLPMRSKPMRLGAA